METYEEVMRRNEPKNYTVRWTSPSGEKGYSTSFSSLEAAQMFQQEQIEDGMLEVHIFRAGRHPSASRQATSAARNRSGLQQNTKTGEVFTNEEAWIIPEGYVDGDADKNGPIVEVHKENRMPALTSGEKGLWYKMNREKVNEWLDRVWPPNL